MREVEALKAHTEALKARQEREVEALKARQERTEEEVFTLTAARAVMLASQEVRIFIGEQPRRRGCSNRFVRHLDSPQFCTMLERVFGALEDNEKFDIAKSLDKMCD